MLPRLAGRGAESGEQRRRHLAAAAVLLVRDVPGQALVDGGVPRHAVACVPGGVDRHLVLLPRRRCNPRTRAVARAISHAAGHPVDTGRDHDRTDGAAVDRFADEILGALGIRSTATAARPVAR